MRRLYEEVCLRFPEIRNKLRFGDDALPYLVMTYVAEWLVELPEEGLSSEIAGRVQAFTRWCERQPSGETAADDIHTILVVGFYEKLFHAERTRAILPKVISKETFDRNAEYLKTWVGEENYAKASVHFR